jgi:hypothetical protein
MYAAKADDQFASKRTSFMKVEVLNEALWIERAELFQSAVSYLRGLFDAPLANAGFAFSYAKRESEGYLWALYSAPNRELRLNWSQEFSEPGIQLVLLKKSDVVAREELASMTICDTDQTNEVSAWIHYHLADPRQRT